MNNNVGGDRFFLESRKITKLVFAAFHALGTGPDDTLLFNLFEGKEICFDAFSGRNMNASSYLETLIVISLFKI
ncbi:hypothetical protein BpHYR1_009822 [Brachionus plicatilis]|uniref:Uncharacterized protein n=1 Tax=Brachionus plicatilis TaxID=10195 RepID=A0A3M7RXB1_BRAPC|nr:hypothetical protein BpHYR1_009822 [Brachionus plicatilis]